MKRLAAIIVIFILLTNLAGCGERASYADESHSQSKPGVSEVTEVSEETKVLEDNIVTVQTNSEIEELETLTGIPVMLLLSHLIRRRDMPLFPR